MPFASSEEQFRSWVALNQHSTDDEYWASNAYPYGERCDEGKKEFIKFCCLGETRIQPCLICWCENRMYDWCDRMIQKDWKVHWREDPKRVAAEILPGDFWSVLMYLEGICSLVNDCLIIMNEFWGWGDKRIELGVGGKIFFADFQITLSLDLAMWICVESNLPWDSKVWFNQSMISAQKSWSKSVPQDVNIFPIIPFHFARESISWYLIRLGQSPTQSKSPIKIV